MTIDLKQAFGALNDAPAPETLADVAREAAKALRGNASLSARLLAAVEREKGGA